MTEKRGEPFEVELTDYDGVYTWHSLPSKAGRYLCIRDRREGTR